MAELVQAVMVLETLVIPACLVLDMELAVEVVDKVALLYVLAVEATKAMFAYLGSKMYERLLKLLSRLLEEFLDKPEKLDPAPKFGKRSLENLATAHPDLQEIANELIQYMDVTVLCGHRSEREQNAAFYAGRSKLMWPRSKHNSMPSKAIDLAPWPIDWQDISRFKKMIELVEMIAKEKKIKLRLGRDFSFKDWPHIELHDKHVEKK
jgi:peptidoglycan L-alanyl-D-glutamate endopeptidase CwlK